MQNRPPSQLFRPGPAQVEDGDEAHNTVGSRTATEAKCHRDLCHPSPLPVLLAITSSKKKGRKRSGPEKCRGKSKEKINEFFLAVLLSSPKPLPTLERDRLFGEGGGQTTTPLHKRDRTPNSQIPSHNFCEMQITPKCVCQI